MVNRSACSLHCIALVDWPVRLTYCLFREDASLTRCDWLSREWMIFSSCSPHWLASQDASLATGPCLKWFNLPHHQQIVRLFLLSFGLTIFDLKKKEESCQRWMISRDPIVFIRVLRDSISRYVGPSVGQSVGWSVRLGSCFKAR